MGARLYEDFDSLAEGADIVAGTVIESVTNTATTSTKARAAAKYQGVNGLRIIAAASQVCSVGTTTKSETSLAISLIHKQPVTKPASGQLRHLNFYDSLGSSSMPSFDLNSDGRWLFRNAARVTVPELQDPAAVPDGTWMHTQIWFDPGTTTSNGAAKLKRTRLDTDATIINGSVVNANMSTLIVGAWRLGTPTAVASAFEFDIDSIVYQYGATDLISAAWAGPNVGDIEPWTTVTLTGLGEGTWTQVSGPAVTLGGSGDVRTYVAPPNIAGATLVFDFGGSQATHTVLPATDFIRQSGILVPIRLRRGADV